MKKKKEYTVLDYDIDDYLEGVVITFKVKGDDRTHELTYQCCRDSERNLFRIDHTSSDSRYGTAGDFSFWGDGVENNVPKDFLPDWDRNDALSLISKITKEVIPDSGYPSDGKTWEI